MPPRTLHPRLTSLWQEKPSRTLHYASLTIVCSSPRTRFTWFSLPRTHSPLHACAEHSRTPNSHPLCCLFIHVRAVSCSFSCRDRVCCSHAPGFFLVFGSHIELEAVHFHPQIVLLLWSLYIVGWESTHFTPSLEVCIFSSSAWSTYDLLVFSLPRTGCVLHVGCELCSLIHFRFLCFPHCWL